MKRTSGLLLIMIATFILTGCSLPMLRETSATPGKASMPEPEFTVEQVVLTQGFQNTEPRIELVRKNNRPKLIVSPGILQSTGMEVSKIEKVDDVFNIHLVNSSYSSADLVIPQITILLSNVSQAEADSLKFKIVNENFTPISVSHGIVDVLNKIRSDFRISSEGYPTIKLVMDDKTPTWVIDYENIYDKANLEIPLINLRLKVNANSGEVVESTKSLISSYLDEGNILNFLPGVGMLYSQKDLESDNTILVYHNLATGEKTNLYRTLSEITSARLNENGTAVVLLEKEGEKLTAFTLTLEDRKAVRIGSEEGINPEHVSWTSTDEIQVITKFSDNQTQVLSYNTKDGNLGVTHSFMMDLATFNVMGDTILASEFIGEETNNRILLSDGRNGLRFVDVGFSPVILSEGLGMHIVNDENSTNNGLHLFNLETLKNEYTLDFDIVHASRISQSELFVVERLPGKSNFGLHIFNFESREITSIGSLTTRRIYLDLASETIYANDSITYDSDAKDIIYTINLNNLKKR